MGQRFFIDTYQKGLGTARAWWNWFLDLVFPRACFGCGTHHTLLCSTCTQKLNPLQHQACFVCRKTPTRFGEPCSNQDCQHKARNVHFDALFHAFCYQTPLLKRLIHTFKYRYITELALPLGGMFGEALAHSSLPLPDTIATVPLHAKRLRLRGFNQSELLVHELTKNPLLADTLPNPSPTLIRIRFTKPQQKLSGKKRRANLHNAFSVPPETSLTGQTIWLIDDVATTGTTLSECARILKSAGAQRVYGVVLGR